MSEQKDLPPVGGEVEVLRYMFDWAGAMCCDGPRNWRVEVERELPHPDFFKDGQAKNLIELVDRAHVTRLQAKNADLQQRLNTADQRVDELQSESFEALYNAAIEERDALKAEVEQLHHVKSMIEDKQTPWPAYVAKVETCNHLQSELTKARELNAELVSALEGMIEYFPEGYSDGEHFSIETAKAAIAHQSAPAAKGGE